MYEWFQVIVTNKGGHFSTGIHFISERYPMEGLYNRDYIFNDMESK